MQGPDDFTVLALTGDLAKDAEQYRSLGNEVVLLNEIKVEGDKIVLEGRLSDLASQQTIVGILQIGAKHGHPCGVAHSRCRGTSPESSAIQPSRFPSPRCLHARSAAA